jgi:hypothetical protein
VSSEDVLRQGFKLTVRWTAKVHPRKATVSLFKAASAAPEFYVSSAAIWVFDWPPMAKSLRK